MDEKDYTKIISKCPDLCDFWAAARCYYPTPWRDYKLTENNNGKDLKDCKCNPSLNINKDIICTECKPDKVLFESNPKYYEEKLE